MTDVVVPDPWQTTTWEGNRHAQLRRSLALTVRERLEALEAMTETSEHFRQLRESGAFYYPDKPSR